MSDDLYPQHELGNDEVLRRLLQRGWDPTSARLHVALRNSRPDIARTIARTLAR